jgi:glutathione S-transferase
MTSPSMATITTRSIRAATFRSSRSRRDSTGAAGQLAKGLAQLEQHLASSAYLLGAQFTAGHAYAFTVVSWCSHVSIDLPQYPRLRAYLARVADRPKVQEALHAEGLLKD